jgi:hypothetical protein
VKQTTSVVWGTGWLPLVESMQWEISATEGSRNVDVQFIDGAGNESPVARDSIVLDRTAPVLDRLTLNGGLPYVLPREPLVIALEAHDAPGGSGLTDFHYTADGGASFSEWFSLSEGNQVSAPRPPEAGRLSMRVVLRDLLGNKSKLSAAAETCLLAAEPVCLGASGSFSGRLADRGEIDAVTFDLVRGDSLSVKVKASALPDRKAVFPLVLDLARPDGERILTGIGLDGLALFTAPATGRYVLVLRQEGEGVETGTYSVAVAVKPAKTSLKGSVICEGGEMTFEAISGSSLKASLRGADLDPATVRIEGPEGDVPVLASGKPGMAPAPRRGAGLRARDRTRRPALLRRASPRGADPRTGPCDQGGS